MLRAGGDEHSIETRRDHVVRQTTRRRRKDLCGKRVQRVKKKRKVLRMQEHTLHGGKKRAKVPASPPLSAGEGTSAVSRVQMKQVYS